MPKVIFKTKELQSVLKTITTFTELSIQKRYTVTINISDNTIYHHNEVATLFAKHDMNVVEEGEPSTVTLDAQMLTKLKLPSKDTLLEWGPDVKGLKIKSGRFSTTMNVIIQTEDIANKEYQPEYAIQFPISKIKVASKLAELPYAFYKNKVELSPIEFSEKDGKLILQGTDGYALFRIQTDFDATPGMSLRVPRIAMKTIFKDSVVDDNQNSSLEAYGNAVVLSDGSMVLYTSQLSEEVKDFGQVLSTLDSNWLVCAKANPKELLSGIKPLYSMIPSKDQKISYIQAVFKRPDNLNLILRHPSMGDTKFDNVPLSGEVSTHNDQHKYYLNMHPQAFHDFTSVLSGFEEIEIFGNNQAAYYVGKDEENGIIAEYLFPVVNI